MVELRQQIYPLDVQRPKLLQESSIASAQAFNQIIKISTIQREKTLNPILETESAERIIERQRDIELTKKEVAIKDKKYTGEQYYVGMITPYPRANNFLYNERNNVGTTSFEK